MAEETVGTSDTMSCQCGPCLKKRGLPHNVTARGIHAYSSVPRGGWRARTTREEAASGASVPTFGIELETDVANMSLRDLANQPNVPYIGYGATAEQVAERERLMREYEAWNVRNVAYRAKQRRRFAESGAISAQEAVSLAGPVGFWHAKQDGSVTGPEFASQPGTLAYWRAQRPRLAAMMQALLHGGLRSHDGDRCGLHVNIGVQSFADAAHLARFARLVRSNERWATRMAMRTNTSKRWARFDESTAEGQVDEWAEQVMRGRAPYCDHAVVLNGSHAGRVEFRLPRGTLRVDRFFAKLEWVASMVEYTRDSHNVTQVSAYMRWTDQSGQYPEVVAFMRERFEGRFAAEGQVAA